jgi:hypothetical protein
MVDRRMTIHGDFQAVVNALFFWQEAHCYEAWLSEVERKHYPAAYR